MIGIYLIKNTITEKIYIGSAVNIQKRFLEHKYALRKKCHLPDGTMLVNYLDNCYN